MKKLIKYLLNNYMPTFNTTPEKPSDRWLMIVGSTIEFEEPQSILENLLGIRK